MKVNNKKGKVILAGAGPGDEELITLKLIRSLKQADVIITDRLVNPSIITNHAKKRAEVIQAGKEGFNDASVSQAEINALIVGYALQGKYVLRLKGGDVAFFSNILDELKTLKENKIPYEIIPGITAASGASAYAGIPLTARGYSVGVQMLAYNPTYTFSVAEFKSLAKTSDTLIMYMASKNLIEFAGQLLKYKKKPTTSVAVIEQATTIFQKIHITTLQNCEDDFRNKEFSSPSIIIIGDVVKLHEQFHWFTTKASGSVFAGLKKKSKE